MTASTSVLQRPWGIALCLAWYWLLLLEFRPPVYFPPDGISLTFNSMMDHMLQGRFDVDPAIVQKEGFLIDGRVYSYWGIFCALLRLPVVLLPGGVHADVTRLSCGLAATLLFLVNQASLRVLQRRALGEQPWLGRGLAMALAFSGVQICFLETTLFQEVCLWAGVFGCWFVHWAVRAGLDPGETRRALLHMALAAGLALLTRVSMGISLYAALGLFLLVAAWRAWRAGRLGLFAAGAMLPCLVAGLFLAVTAGVNQMRWGDPLTFADYRHYLFNLDFPDRWPRTQRFGLFSVERIPLGLVYYFFPAWVVTGPDGKLLLADRFRLLIDSAELPPSSFLLTDAWACLMLLPFVRFALRRRADHGAVALGLAVGPLMMLMAISLCYRYRIEFYPLLLFGAMMGAAALAREPAERIARWRRWSTPLLAVSIVSSLAVLLLYKMGDLGPAHILHLSRGVLAYYAGASL